MNTVNNNRKQVLDDMFDAFTMLAGGNYVSLYDVEGKLTRYTPAAVELLGLPGEYIPDGAYDWVDYVHPEDRKRYLDAMEEMFAKNTRTYDLSYRTRTKNGDYMLFRYIGAVIRTAEGNPSLIGGIMINEGIIENIDSVTILPNHYAFFNNLPEIMKKNTAHTILLLGINHMANINESLGYSHGNRVLQQVSWVIQEAVRDKGTVYRKEGAKFAIVSEVLSEADMTIVFRKIRQKLLSSIRVDEMRHNLTINGGMLSVKGFQMDPRTIQASLNYAYQESKTRKHGSLVNFDGTKNHEVTDSLQMLSVIRNDLIAECKGFYLEYQPVLSAQDEKPIGVEALLRWKNDTYGTVLPDDFLPILEKDVAFEELGDWILRTALADGTKLLEKDPNIVMGINISPTQLGDEYFIDSLQQILKRTGFPAKNLCLEFTKECRLLDTMHLGEVVLSLHALGIKIVLDDYGTGNDSLDFLKVLAADYIKFDRKFVQHLEESEQDRHALKHLTELAQVYGPNICVKGIETPETAAIIKSYPVRSVQGNLYSSPIALDDLLRKYWG